MKMSRKMASDLGLLPKGPPRGRAKDGKTGCDAAFDALCQAHGLPVPVHEYEFAKELGRKWRADYIFAGWILVEKVGGVWIGGHHSRGQSQLDDMDRRNHAALLGYVVLEFSPQQFDSGEAFAFIKKVLDAGGEQS